MPVPVLAPDGTVRQIPDDQLQAAMNAGGKRAFKVADPQGTMRWIPEEKVKDAVAAGGKLDNGQKGFFGSLADATGVSNFQPSDLLSIASPSEAAMKLGRGLLDEGKRVYGEAKAAYNSTDPTEMQRHGTAAVPFVGGGIVTAGKQVDEGNYAGAAGTFAGTLANEFGLELAPSAARLAGKTAGAVAEGTSNAVSAAKDRIYPTSKSVAPAQAAARNLGKALVVPVQAMPNFVGAASEEAGTIKAYAKANNLPINSTVDLANAAEATAKAVQGHYDTAIMGPNAKEIVSVPPDYRGSKLNVEGSRATLADVNSRINAINQELNPELSQGDTGADFGGKCE
jgi:hypothetical protein